MTLRLCLLIACCWFGFIAKGQAPVANFTASVTEGCAPLVVQFTDQSPGATSWSWNLGGTPSAQQHPSISFTSPGTYNISLTASNASGSNTKTMNGYIVVHPNPTVNFSGTNLNGCAPLTSQFTSTSTPGTPGPATYLWNFGDGNNGPGQNTSHTYTGAGNYNVTLVVTNSEGCNASHTKPAYVHVNGGPTASFTFTTMGTFCNAPATVNFTALSTGTGTINHQWNFGDGPGFTTGNNPSHTYLTNGTFSVTLIATDGNGCKDTIVQTNAINLGTLQASFTTVGPYCPNDSTTFANTTPGATSFEWNFNDGSPLEYVPALKHKFPTAGTYNVQMIAHAGPCSDTVVIPVTIHPKPTANFTASPLPPCPAPSTVNFQNLSTGANAYSWAFGDGGNSTASSPPHTYGSNGTYDVTLIATSAQGCKDTMKKNAYIGISALSVTAIANKTGICFPDTVRFDAMVGYSQPVLSYHWDFGPGQGTSSLKNPWHVYTAYGQYQVILTVTTTNNCVAKDTIIIKAGTKPVAAFTATPTTACVKQDITFTNTTTGALTYLWSFGDGGSSTAHSPVYKYNSSGLFNVTLIAENNGCGDTMTRMSYITINPPHADFAATFNCDTPDKVVFTNLSSAHTSLLWHFGDGNTSTASNPVHTYSGSNHYFVKLVTYNATYGCVDSTIETVTVLNPQINFSAVDSTICKNDTATFIAAITNGLTTPFTYTWVVDGIVFPDTTSTFKYKFVNTGYHTVWLITKDIHNCKDTAKKLNYVLVSIPTVDFTASPLSGCVPLNVAFNDLSTVTTGSSITNRTWHFGNGNTASVTPANTSYTYNTAGVFDVKLVVTDIVGCKDSLTKPAYITARKPIANFVALDTAVCRGDNVSFFNSSGNGAVNAIWDFGDGSPVSNAWQPMHTYNQLGNYTVRLIVEDAFGCKDTLTRTNYINISKPTASFTMSDTMAICPPLTVSFDATGSANAVSYLWDFGNGNTSTLPTPTDIFTTSGIFNVTLVATNGQGCKDTIVKQVKILGYAGVFTYTPLLGCNPLTVNFTANVTNVPTLIWDFSDGNTLNTGSNTTATHTYTTPGAYLPKLILDDNMGCLTSSLGIDSIRVDDVTADFSTGPACINSDVVFKDESKGYYGIPVNWIWKFHEGPPSSQKAPSHFYDSLGSYPVTLVVTNANGCVDSVTKNVTINPLPVIDAGPDTVICVNDAAQLAGSGGVSYTWTGIGLSCLNCPDPLASPSFPSTYYVKGTDQNGCANTDSVKVGLKTKTDSDVDPGREVCSMDTITLRAYGAQTYEWFPPATLSDPTSPTPIATPIETITYTVVAREGSCIPDTNKVKIIANPLPTVSAGSDVTIVNGKTTVLVASGKNISSFLWMPGESLSCDKCADPVASPQRTTTYTVVVYTDKKCTDTDDVLVRVICDQSQVFIPNSFTPNGDGANDVFYPRGTGIDNVKTFRIYNRWGEIVYERNAININDKTNGWDGTFKGQPLPPDIFVYFIEATCMSGELLQWKGDISIVR